MIALCLGLVVVLMLVFLDAYDRTLPKYRAFQKLSGPGIRFPLIGNSYVFMMFNALSGWTEMRKHAKQYPNGYAYYYHNYLLHCIYTAEAFEEVMTLTKTKKGYFYNFVRPYIGLGILTSFSNKWFARRRMITPAFHFKILKKFYPIFRSHSTDLVDEIATQSDEPVDVAKMFARFSLNLICETSIGVPITEASEYHESLVQFGDLTQNQIFSPWAHFDIIYNMFGYKQAFDKCVKPMHEFTRRLIAKRREGFQLEKHKAEFVSEGDADESIGYNKNSAALLDTLLAAQIEHGTISDEGIQEEVDTFVFTGHDTVSAGMTYIMLCIAEHPDIQQRVYEEIESVCPNDEPLTPNHIASCTYMDMVIKEALRIFPPVPLIIRELVEECEINGVMCPVGTDVILFIVDLHRDERWFPDPLKFIPERFLPENLEKRHRFAYVPFSAGVRNCIGQKYAMLEMKTMLITVLKAYRMEAVTKIKDLVFVMDLIMHTNHPVKIKFIGRKHV